MKTLLTLILLGTFSSLFGQTAQPPRLDRAHSYFGLHFDFHAGPDCKEVGKNVDASLVNNLIDRVKPDFIQVDCKGHPGYSSYPTKVGNQVPGFSKDELHVTLQATPVVKNNGLACNGWIAELMSLSQGVIPGKDVVSFGKYYQAVNMDGPSETAATITKYGKGELAATYLELGKASAIRSAPYSTLFPSLVENS